MKDTRDLRDPHRYGMALGSLRFRQPDTLLHELADWIDHKVFVSPYSGGPYMSAPPQEHHMYGFDFSDTEPGGD